MVILFQRALAPYRVSLFNALSEELNDEFAVVLARGDPTPDRQWRIPWEEVRFKVVVLPGRQIQVGRETLELSRQVRMILNELQTEHVIVAGWDVFACWTALWWARVRSVPVLAWVESSVRTGRRRGMVMNSLRRLFLSLCNGAIVPGEAAESFVHSLTPALVCHRAPNSIDSPELRSLASPPRGGAALYVGELSERKGCDILLRAAPDLLSVFPRVIVAGDGPLRGDFDTFGRGQPSFECHGFVDPPTRARLMGQASVVLLPSRRDPWPLAACEALVARRPLVAGPGVGSVADLCKIAGDAVVAMADDNPATLTVAATRARGRVVADHLRCAFSPECTATSMAAAIRTTRGNVGSTGP